MSKKENNFEESMDKLENIVTELEKGNLNLDETLKKFEEGIKLSKECNEILQDAEKRITILIENANGDIEESDFGGIS
ncbi:MAG: exodeoxyribonuclease VII small subunit [Clostridia bacterium]|nr:exodeoxyribonuclease VII small subunit [Clostridia bacterium]